MSSLAYCDSAGGSRMGFRVPGPLARQGVRAVFKDLAFYMLKYVGKRVR